MYAASTVVSVDKSRAEIEATLVRYGAEMFFSGWDDKVAFVAFRLRERHIKLTLPLPQRDERRFTHHRDRYGRVSRRWSMMRIARARWEMGRLALPEGDGDACRELTP